MEEFDINISTKLSRITGLTEKGITWINVNVDGSECGVGYADDASMLTEIAECAMSENLSVSINGRQYLGANRVAC